jgi:hypothetical protein
MPPRGSLQDDTSPSSAELKSGTGKKIDFNDASIGSVRLLLFAPMKDARQASRVRETATCLSSAAFQGKDPNVFVTEMAASARDPAQDNMPGFQCIRRRKNSRKKSATFKILTGDSQTNLIFQTTRDRFLHQMQSMISYGSAIN